MSTLRSRISSILLLTVVAGAFLASGCSKGGKQTADAGGTVKIDGRPMTFGRVQFSPIASGDALNAGKAAFGFINQDGTFELTTFKDGDGAVVGSHRVIISSRSRPVKEGEQELSPPDDVPSFEYLKLVGQKFEVVSGEDNQFDIEITSDQIRKYGEQE